MSARHFEDYAPGHGRAAPRAALDSDPPSTDLNGDWAFRLSPTLHLEPDGVRNRRVSFASNAVRRAGQSRERTALPALVLPASTYAIA